MCLFQNMCNIFFILLRILNRWYRGKMISMFLEMYSVNRNILGIVIVDSKDEVVGGNKMFSQ